MNNIIPKLSVIAAVLFSGSVFAAPPSDTGLITFDGAVTDTTCTVTTNNGIDTNNLTISMPIVSKTDVSATTLAAGGVGGKEFELMLTGCPVTGGGEDGTSTLTATIAFTSQQFAELSSGTLKPDAAVTGAAENVNIALFNNTSTNQAPVMIGNPADASQSLALGDKGEGVFAYKAAYVPSADFNAETNPVISGKVNTNATFTIAYQ